MMVGRLCLVGAKVVLDATYLGAAQSGASHPNTERGNGNLPERWIQVPEAAHGTQLVT
jgi:hypothetical protein